MTARQTVPLTPNGRTVLERRYLKRGPDGTPTEEPEDLFRRVAEDIAANEEQYGGSPREYAERFLEITATLDFLPNSPTLLNAGRDLEQLAACFVLPIEDSLDSIFETLKLAVLVHQSGGGTGFSFSRLRPQGDTVKTTMGVSSGPVSFVTAYDAATDVIKQGSFRRGANMAILRVDHPDVLDFVNLKRAGGITNFNLSVGVTEDWMEAAQRGELYEIVNPRTEAVVARRNAGEVMEAIAKAAWESGDPGIVFLDRINHPRTNPTPALGAIEATNPCGEQPLLPYEACVLGSINLGHFVAGGSLDWDRLAAVAALAVRFLDNAVDRSHYPIPAIEKMHKYGNRKIGLGVMGWADVLVRLGIPYASQQAVDLAGEVMGFIRSAADDASSALAVERGSFSNWEQSIYGPGGSGVPMRNATRTTIAPTGSISIIAGASSGIEPHFALSYHRKVLDGQILTEVVPEFEAAARSAGVWSEEFVAAVTSQGGLHGIDGVPDDMKAVFATAHEIAPEWHVRHQAAFQQNVDNAVSKTINLSSDATWEDVREVYRLAWQLGCKGITVYRDGAKTWQVLNRGRPGGTDLGTVEGSAPAAEEDLPTIPPSRGQNVLEVCPVCGQAAFEFGETCGKCHSCGHSTC